MKDDTSPKYSPVLRIQHECTVRRHFVILFPSEIRSNVKDPYIEQHHAVVTAEPAAFYSQKDGVGKHDDIFALSSTHPSSEEPFVELISCFITPRQQKSVPSTWRSSLCLEMH